VDVLVCVVEISSTEWEVEADVASGNWQMIGVYLVMQVWGWRKVVTASTMDGRSVGNGDGGAKEIVMYIHW